jgi:hypothetical protein
VTVSLLLQGGAQNTVGAGGGCLSGIENLIGSAFNDTLTGDGNSNVLTGGAGNDMLLGGLVTTRWMAVLGRRIPPPTRRPDRGVDGCIDEPGDEGPQDLVRPALIR